MPQFYFSPVAIYSREQCYVQCYSTGDMLFFNENRQMQTRPQLVCQNRSHFLSLSLSLSAIFFWLTWNIVWCSQSLNLTVSPFIIFQQFADASLTDRSVNPLHPSYPRGNATCSMKPHVVFTNISRCFSRLSSDSSSFLPVSSRTWLCSRWFPEDPAFSGLPLAVRRWLIRLAPG